MSCYSQGEMNLGFSLQRSSYSEAHLNEGAMEALKLLVRSPFLEESAFVSYLARAEALLEPVVWCGIEPVPRLGLEFGSGCDCEKQETQW